MSGPEPSAAIVRRLLAEVQADRLALRDRAAEARLYASGPTNTGERAAATALALDRCYSALESILERIARTLESALPPGPDWHRILLRNAGLAIERVRPVILGPPALAAADDLRRFRHFLRHAYAAALDVGRVMQVAASWLAALDALHRDLDLFERFLEELAERLEASA